MAGYNLEEKLDKHILGWVGGWVGEVVEEVSTFNAVNLINSSGL